MTSPDKVAIVTGAATAWASAVAGLLARRGLALALVDRDAGALRATSEDLSGRTRVLALAQDLTSEDGPEAVVAETLRHWGKVDMLVNNAGYGAIEPFLDMTAELWDRTLAINVTALAMLTAAAGRVMREARSGRIVNITSPASRMALPNYTAYAASKAGVDCDHARRGGRARAVRRARQQRRAGHDGHRDAALDRGRPRARSKGRDRPRGLPRRAHAAHSARPPRRAATRSPQASSGWRSTRPTTSPPSGSTSAAASTRTEPMRRVDNLPARHARHRGAASSAPPTCAATC